MAGSLPHPIPYQGSKRQLAARICTYLPGHVNTLYEPFAGSAAVTIYAASRSLADHFVIGDISAPLAQLLSMMINDPQRVINGYRQHWIRGVNEGLDYYYEVREDFNASQDPVDLLYLSCRAVKNSPRYSSTGRFTQSVDKRRLGTHPDSMRTRIVGLSELLHGRSTVLEGDWRATLESASTDDFVYLDPPYEGVSTGRDRRYVRQLSRSELTAGLVNLNSRHIPFALSYDGMTGGKVYGEPLPAGLYDSQVMLNAGVSTQSTLNGRVEDTVESLYVSLPNRRRTTDLIMDDPTRFDRNPGLTHIANRPWRVRIPV